MKMSDAMSDYYKQKRIEREREKKMSLVNELKNKRNNKIIEFAGEFIKQIKPKLINSAEKGYSSYSYNIDTDIPEEKGRLQIYSNSSFIELLNNNLDGVKVEYVEEILESALFKTIKFRKRKIIFTWG
jgi:hypothetical protein